jgi:hypothetical protein
LKLIEKLANLFARAPVSLTIKPTERGSKFEVEIIETGWHGKLTAKEAKELQRFLWEDFEKC